MEGAGPWLGAADPARGSDPGSAGHGGAYLLPGLGPRWEFVLSLRATRLAGLLVVGVAIAVATVLFQTISRNRILTPQIMGFDALFIMLQTLLVAVLGPVGFASLPGVPKFAVEVAVLVLARCCCSARCWGGARGTFPG